MPRRSASRSTIETLELAAPGPGEVRVRVQAVAICHSDVSQADGAWGGELPVVYGHEAAGVVEEVGDGRRARGRAVGGGDADPVVR